MVVGSFEEKEEDKSSLLADVGLFFDSDMSGITIYWDLDESLLLLLLYCVDESQTLEFSGLHFDEVISM